MQQPGVDKIRDLKDAWTLFARLPRFTASVRPDLIDLFGFPYPGLRIVRSHRAGVAPGMNREYFRCDRRGNVHWAAIDADYETRLAEEPD
jgi:hypothetical protein